MDFARIQSRDNLASQEYAAPGFGSNICYRSPLIRHLEADIQSGQYGPDARPLFLDAGAGAGYNTNFLVGLGARVVANDQSTQQLAILRGCLGHTIGSSIHLNDGDILAKDFPEATFDGILASHLFNYLRPRELETLVGRFRRWLRPGGRLYIQCWNIEEGIFQPFRPIWEEARKAGKPWPGSIENAQARAVDLMDRASLAHFREGFRDYVHAIEPDDLVNLLKASGFTVDWQVNDFPGQDDYGRRAVSPGCEVMVVAEAVTAPASLGPGDGEGAGGASATGESK